VQALPTGETVKVDPLKLMQAIKEDLKSCLRSRGNLRSDDAAGRMRNKQEFETLTTHVLWIERVGDDREELERVLTSLENSKLVRAYQRWKKTVRG
jgi:hypothetical protein